MAVITSLHTYNFHLIISYLGQDTEIIRFDDKDIKREFDYYMTNVRGFNKNNRSYLKKILTSKFLSEIVTFEDQLIGIQNSSFKRFPLQEDSNNFTLNFGNDEIDFISKISTSQLSLDSNCKKLYLISEPSEISDELEIFQFQANKSLHRNNIKRINLELFKKINNITISNMVSKDNNIALSIRGFGCSIIRDYINNIPKETIYRSEDAQDVIFSQKYNLVFIADAFEGLLTFELNNNKKALHKIKLFDNDFPQEIKLFMGRILIKGKKGLYLYNISSRKINKIWDGSVGAMTTYYNYIFFSSRGEIHLLCKSNLSVSNFEFLGENAINIKKNIY